MSPRAILSVKYLAAPSASQARTAVAGFLRYIQYRDHHQDLAADTSRMLRYVSHRDPTQTRGQLFDRSGRAGDLESKALVAHVRRSLRDLPPGPRPQRAVYRLVLSPADARGLDLRELTRATMAALERDAGSLPPWVAAVHRNTQHPHVHIVMAARREISPDQFRTLTITRPRLARMKETLGLEMSRQLDRSPRRRNDRRTVFGDLVRVDRNVESSTRERSRTARLDRPGANRGRAGAMERGLAALAHGLRRAARRYQLQIERELLEEERQRLERGGWER